LTRRLEGFARSIPKEEGKLESCRSRRRSKHAEEGEGLQRKEFEVNLFFRLSDPREKRKKKKGSPRYLPYLIQTS